MKRRDAIALLIGSGALGTLGGIYYEKHRGPKRVAGVSGVGPAAFPIQFSDVTRESGILFEHNNGAFGKKYLPETLGSGCAFFDYDNDGWPDILLVNGMDWPEIGRAHV